MSDKYIVDKEGLYNYLLNSYKSKYGKDISPIKLQKGLYFLFAFWAQKISQIKKSKECNEGYEIYGNYSEYLFDADFQAWAYGPVDHDIYSKYKSNKEINTKGLTSNLVIFSQKVQYSVESPIDPSKGLMK